MPVEKSYILTKPDGVLMGVQGEVEDAARSEGLRVTGSRRLRLSQRQARELYPERVGDTFERETFDYVTSGDCICTDLEGEDAVRKARVIKGKTWQSGLRLKYAQNFVHNTFHCPDDEEQYKREEVILRGTA